MAEKAEKEQAARKATELLQKLRIQLEPALAKICNIEPITRAEYMDFYNLLFNFCTAKDSGFVSEDFNFTIEFGGDGLYQIIREWLKSHLDRVLADGNDLQGEELLRFYSKQWLNFQFSSRVLDGVCRYLNDHWVHRKKHEKKNCGIYRIYQLALFLWREKLFAQVTPALLNLIQKDRDGEAIDGQLIKHIVDCCVELGIEEYDPGDESKTQEDCRLSVYREYFENKLLSATAEYYSNEAAVLVSELSISEYMKKVEKRIQQESQRVHDFLHPSTLKPLLRAVEKAMIEDHVDFCRSGFLKLLQHYQEEDLSRMFNLLSRVPDTALPPLREQFDIYVTSQGVLEISSASATAATDPKLYVQTLLKVHAKYACLVKNAFAGDRGFSESLDKACAKFVNRNAVTQPPGAKETTITSKSPELLAKYCDLLLKKTNKNEQGEDLEELLKDCMVIFGYVDDKDVFQKFYQNLLSKRLVGHLSASDDAESSMISKLKEACGVEYTVKLQRMFTDISTSKDFNIKFREHCDSAGKLDFEFSVEVLTNGAWPFKLPPPLTLPQEMEQCVSRFTSFYSGNHSGRKLQWLYQHSKGEVVTNCFKNRYTIQVSTWQMAVLLLFNAFDSMPLSQLQETTGIDLLILKQTLAVLLKAKLLQVEGSVKVVQEEALQPTTVFIVFPNYMNKKLRININVPLRTEAKIADDATMKSVEEDRVFVIQAAIVRILKARKSISHQALVLEVLDQLSTKFKPQMASIKKQIGILIEKEYLKRDEEDEKLYHYVA